MAVLWRMVWGRWPFMVQPGSVAVCSPTEQALVNSYLFMRQFVTTLAGHDIQFVVGITPTVLIDELTRVTAFFLRPYSPPRAEGQELEGRTEGEEQRAGLNHHF